MRLESWIEQIVEEPFVRLFNGQLLPQEVARHLVNAIEDGEQVSSDGTIRAPCCYRISLHPMALDAMRRTHPNIEAELSQGLADLIVRMNIRITCPPEVFLRADPALPPRGIRIVTLQDGPQLEPTRELRPEKMRSLAPTTVASTRHAYLIIAGQRIFDLTTPAIRMGRAFDNDLILEDRRVSRYHAQLRLRYGRYVLQDLGSSGGTLVNGYPVQELALRPGDVLSLGGLEVIFAEEPSPKSIAAPALGDTQPKGGQGHGRG